MLTVEQGLSENIMYPVLLEDGSFKYYTKDGVNAYKKELDKKLKNYNLLNIIRWVIFSICINLATWQIIDRHQMFLFRKFLDVYGCYFSFNRHWEKISQNNSKRLRCPTT